MYRIALGIINDKSTALGVCATIGLGVAGLALLLLGHWGMAVLVCGGFLFGWAYGGVSVQTPFLVRAAFGRRSYAQVFLRSLLQRDIVIIPKTTSKVRMQENLNIFDFVISESEMEQIKGLDENKSLWCAYDDPMIVEYAMAEE